MAKQIAEKIKSNTIVQCKDMEIIQGDIDSPLWVMITPDEKLKVVLDVDEYIDLMDSMKQIMKENFELKLEKAILSEFPIDYDDVKAVVLEEMKNDDEKSIYEIVQKVKTEHPNLFYNLNLDKLF
ncbi:DUF2603 domain-containing protein [Caminibacter pacificus]|uniref:DUF2603 domain-containing protein n=1 Tax=Caminibacter pacificus TaxID=1424653 RepID=A0AAJ4RBV8_9BACT|nr:DUF2603 domain-containing protein [Caminibacter pacificus]NPA88407.1 DUF2603 domain-containing protein [Campylobacterota bacterium]QCI28783.1 DUF2603 domain-containing protein [Caminibacter pacificus]ROR39371.1 uncharacterized protein DUF2603 [Caminibacter pacificus]